MAQRCRIPPESCAGLAAEGILKWDGTTEDLLKARVGVYVIWIELFEPDGGKVVQKLSCVLAGEGD